MLNIPSFTADAKKLAPGELDQLAKDAQIDPIMLCAFIEVEAPKASGFDYKGRPVILYEFHKMYHNCLVSPVRGILKASRDAGLAYPNWDRSRYPRGTINQQADGNYALLERAQAIDEECALMSCSWGIGQVMGDNWRMLRRASVFVMVREAMASEANQIAHMIDYLRGADLIDDIQRKSFYSLARGYNGPGQVEAYAAKLAATYDRLRAATRKEIAPLPPTQKPAA